jgi:hypothetical protein
MLMSILTIPYLRARKLRGIRRNCRKLIERVNAIGNGYPEEDRPGCGYWHEHLPADLGFIDSPRTPYGVRQSCIQALVNTADHLRKRRPAGLDSRVVAAISVPNLWDAQIIVFFGQEYWSTFFDRSSPDQEWTPLPRSRSIVRECALSVPEEMMERGYREIIRDDDYESRTEIWFIGELT